MFTVMHRLGDGTECYYEAKTVRRYPLDGEQSIPPLGKFLLVGVNIPDVPGDTLELVIEKPFGAIFVMNSAGTTIAKYMDRSPPTPL